MGKVTISKLQIAQAKECAHRAERYMRGLDAIIKMCEIVLPISQYNRMPDEFRLDQKRSMQTIIRDLRSMINESLEIWTVKNLKANDLSYKRKEELENDH